MLRLFFLPLLLFTISIACMGQTFQYSRGWTNGKRSSTSSPTLNAHFHRDEELLPELFELQDNERRLEKCLLEIQHYIRNPLQLHPLKYASAAGVAAGISPSSNNNNNNNNLFANHHQSSELFEDLSAAEASDYLKH